MKKISLKFLPLFVLGCLSPSSAQVPTISSFAPMKGHIGTSVIITGTNFSRTPNTVSVLRNRESQPLYNVVDEPAGDQETVQYETFKETQLYPNPAYNLLTIKLGGFKDTDDVHVVVVDG